MSKENKTVILVIKNRRVYGYVSELKEDGRTIDSYWDVPSMALRFRYAQAIEIINNSHQDDVVLIPIDSKDMYLISKQEL